MAVSFTVTTRIAAPPDEVFDLCLDIEAHERSLASSRERAVGGTTTGRLAPGDEVRFRAWHFGIRFALTSRITEYERPHRFVDEQVRGPFSTYRHEHRFADGGGVTVMEDEVSFVAPFGALGRLVERLVLARYLRELIEERNGSLKAELESGRPGSSPVHR